VMLICVNDSDVLLITDELWPSQGGAGSAGGQNNRQRPWEVACWSARVRLT